MADETEATKPKQEHVAAATRSHTKGVLWAVVVIVVIAILGGGLLYWYNNFYKPNHFYSQAISQADAAFNNGDSTAYDQATQSLSSEIPNFRTADQKEAGYRRLARLYDGESAKSSALVAYLHAEAIHQTNDLPQIVRIATLADLTNDRSTAITYYQRAVSVYNINKAVYQKDFPQAYVDSWSRTVAELQKETGQ